jgi:hypothetical protein
MAQGQRGLTSTFIKPVTEAQATAAQAAAQIQSGIATKRAINAKELADEISERLAQQTRQQTLKEESSRQKLVDDAKKKVEKDEETKKVQGEYRETKKQINDLTGKKTQQLEKLVELHGDSLSYKIKSKLSFFTSFGSSATEFTKNINASMPYKIIFLIAFFALFYNVIFNICIFFGIDIVLLNMYMGWVSFLLVLFTFLPTNYSDVFKKKDETV